MAKDESPKPHLFMGKIESNRPRELLAMDFALIDKSMGIKDVLIVTDIFTGYSFVAVTPLPNQPFGALSPVPRW